MCSRIYKNGYPKILEHLNDLHQNDSKKNEFTHFTEDLWTYYQNLPKNLIGLLNTSPYQNNMISKLNNFLPKTLKHQEIGLFSLLAKYANSANKNLIWPLGHQKQLYSDDCLGPNDIPNYRQLEFQSYGKLNLTLNYKPLKITPADISYQKQVMLMFDENAPRWRSARRGISFKARCRNRFCEAGSMGDWVLVNKGFGVFSIGETITSLRCPVCNKRVNRAENCGFFNCKWRFKGKKVDQNEGLEECGERVAGNDAYYTFAESNERWIYLKVEVREKDRDFLMENKINCN